MSDWIQWHGGECPVSEDTVVDVRIIGLSYSHTRRAGDLDWWHGGGVGDIVAYRVVEPDVSKQDHYTAHGVQPIEYIVGNELDFLEGNVVKYVTRYKRKGGVEDLKKARVYLDWLIEREETGGITAHK